MATGVKAAGFLALVRILTVAFPEAHEAWQPVVAGLAIATMVLGKPGGAVAAVAQADARRLHRPRRLPAHLGGARLGTAATLLYLVAYGLTTLAAFGILGVLGRGGEREVTLDSIAGLGRAALARLCARGVHALPARIPRHPRVRGQVGHPRLGGGGAPAPSP